MIEATSTDIHRAFTDQNTTGLNSFSSVPLAEVSSVRSSKSRCETEAAFVTIFPTMDDADDAAAVAMPDRDVDDGKIDWAVVADTVARSMIGRA